MGVLVERQVARIVLAMATIVLAGGCQSAPATERPLLDLVSELPRAERRAAGDPARAVRAAEALGQRALLMDAPSRAIYALRMPNRARFRTSFALLSGTSVTVRLGLSDERRYHELMRFSVDGSLSANGKGAPMDVDLASFSGWQWSIFYRPAHRTWKLILNADATPGGAVAWIRPAIVTR